MLEFLLFATVPESQHEHVSRILTGLCAMDAVPLREAHLLYRPLRDVGSIVRPGVAKPGARPMATPPQGGGSINSTDLFVLQLVGRFEEEDSERTPTSSQAMSQETVVNGKDHSIDMHLDDAPMLLQDGQTNGTAIAAQPANIADSKSQRESNTSWRIEFRDWPEAGARPVTMRTANTTYLKTGNPFAWMDDLGYRYEAKYFLHGSQWTHNNIRISMASTLVSKETAKQSGAGLTSEQDILATLRNPQSNSVSSNMLFQASIMVADPSKLELINSATKELLALKESLRGIVDLEPGNRLALDTRVR